MDTEIAFEIATSSIRFGAGVTAEVGQDLADLGLKRVAVLTDPVLSRLRPVSVVQQSLWDHGISFRLFDRVRIEPNDASFADAMQAR